MPKPGRSAALRGALAGLILFGIFQAASEPGRAAPAVILPPGLVVEGTVYRRNGTSVPFIDTGIDANSYLFSVPPTESFHNEADAGVVYRTEPLQFVRFYTDGVTSPLGSFIVRPDIIRGLSATEIRDILALPYMPDSLTIVLIPAGTCVLSGIVAPVLGDFPANPPNIPTPGPWGEGGAEQSYIIGKTDNQNCQGAQFLPGDDYVNQQSLGAHALWYEPLAGRGNPGAVALMLDHLPPVAPYGDLYNVYNALDLLNFGDPTQLRAALAQLGGQGYADVAAIEIKTGQNFSNLLLNRVAAARDLAADAAGGAAQSQFLNSTADDAAGVTPKTRLWLSGSGGIGSLAGDGGKWISDTDYKAASIAAGLDHRLAPGAIIGAAAGYAYNSFSLDDLSEDGRIDSYQAALYAGFAQGPWHFDGTIGYAFEAGDVKRHIYFPGVSRRMSGEPDADMLIAAFETGYGFDLDQYFVATPFARLQATSVFQDSFAENGGGAIGLDVKSQTVDSLRSILGLQVDWISAAPADTQELDVRLRAGWAHEYADDAGIVTASFVDAPGGSFTVKGASFGRDSLAVEFQSGVEIDRGLRAFMMYDGDIAANSSAHVFSGGFDFAW